MRCTRPIGRTPRARCSARSRRSTGTTSCSSSSASTARCCRRSCPRAGTSADGLLFGARVPIRGIAGDQQAALFGQGCRRPGEAKVTYGTGSFVLVHAGDDASAPPHGLLKTAAADGYAVEGAVLVSGAALQWLRDGLGLIGDAARERGACPERPVDRGGCLRARADRSRLAVVGPGRARADRRDHAGHDARAPRPGGAGGDRASGRRRGRRAAAAPRRSCAPTAARRRTAS